MMGREGRDRSRLKAIAHGAPLVLGGLVLLSHAGWSQTTRPERTGWSETSTVDDVNAFIDSLGKLTPSLRVGIFTRSTEGREVRYLIASRPVVADPAEAHRGEKPIIYLQGNIHGGEVEGKEAALMLLRDLTVGHLGPLLDSVILIVVPVYNADGNDALGPGERNRPGQNGPATVGKRGNGQGLDLNRDLVKEQAPETRALIAMVNRWDPDIYVDLHATNGSYHGYALTYSPGLNPNGSPANDYVRDKLLPAVRRSMRGRHRMETFWYGNFENQEPDSLRLGWRTFSPDPRFATNWFGLRNRMSILSEAYSNASFEERVKASYNFALEILRYAARSAKEIKRVNRAAAQHRPDSIAIRADYAAPFHEEVIAEITGTDGEGSNGFARRRRTGTFKSIKMPIYGWFKSTHSEPRRPGYLIPPARADIVERLERQGIAVSQLRQAWSGDVEAFRIDSTSISTRQFEQHRLASVRGRYQRRAATADSGWYLVSTDQRLGVLAAVLLEPMSQDGFVTWNLFDADLRGGSDYPILRALELPKSVVEVER